jgi:hypothetical protein
MGEVIPLVPALKPQVDAMLARQAAFARAAKRRYNLIHHGLPTGFATATLLVGLAATTLIDREPAEPTELRCGVGVAETGAGYYSVLDSALTNAGVAGSVSKSDYENAADRLAAIDSNLHPGERFVVTVQDGRIALDSIRQIHQPVNSCAELGL